MTPILFKIQWERKTAMHLNINQTLNLDGDIYQEKSYYQREFLVSERLTTVHGTAYSCLTNICSSHLPMHCLPPLKSPRLPSPSP